MQRGDALVVCFDAPVPFILRPLDCDSDAGNGITYIMVGTAYVGGVMNRELVDEVCSKGLEDAVTFVMK
jgi:hypothetical protein